jgi:hypothetical protein
MHNSAEVLGEIVALDCINSFGPGSAQGLHAFSKMFVFGRDVAGNSNPPKTSSYFTQGVFGVACA